MIGVGRPRSRRRPPGPANHGSVGLESRPSVDLDRDAVGEDLAGQACSPDRVLQRRTATSLLGPDMRQTFGRHHHRDAVVQLPPAFLPLGPEEELVGGHLLQRRGHGSDLKCRGTRKGIICPSASFSARPSVHRRDGEARAVLDARRPARGHRLGPGVEADRIRPVLVQVAEARALPAAEGVVGDRHRDRHVDADHADLDLGWRSRAPRRRRG